MELVFTSINIDGWINLKIYISIFFLNHLFLIFRKMAKEGIQPMRCNLNDKENIIEQLLEKDLTNICFKIFSFLDSTSFCNCRLVCHGWRDFIDHQFYELQKGKKWRMDKLMSNYLNKDFIPKEEKISFNDKEQTVADVVADQSNILISINNFHNYGGCNGDCICLSSYELHSLKLAWSLKLNDFNSKFLSKYAFNHTYDISLHLNNDRVYASVSIEATVYVIDRARGHVIDKISDMISISAFDSFLNCGLKSLENKLLAMASSQRIKILNIENLENPLFIFHDTINDQELKNEKFESDGNKLIFLCVNSYDFNRLYRPNNQYIIARDFNTGNKLHQIQVQRPVKIMDFKVRWPYVICVTKNPRKEKLDGIKIFDMEKENVLKEILWKFSLKTKDSLSLIEPMAIEIKNKIVIVKEYCCIVHNNAYKHVHCARILKYEDLFDDKFSTIDDLSSRQVEESGFNKNIIMAGNSFLTIFESYLLKRSYWISSVSSCSQGSNDAKCKFKDEFGKSKNDTSNADEGTNRKKKKIN